MITKTTMATSSCEVNYFKRAKKTRHLRRKQLRNCRESRMLCYGWLVSGSYICPPSLIRATEHRGREHPVQEVGGAGSPGSQSLNPSRRFTGVRYRNESAARKQALRGQRPARFTKPGKSSAQPHIFCFPEERLCSWVSG